MIQAIIFDLDGLLVDSEPCWDTARRQLAAEVGRDWNLDDKRACMGVSTTEWATHMIKRLGLEMDAAQTAAVIVGKMREIYAREIPFLPGALAAVELAASCYPTALASGSERSLIATVIQDEALRGKFQAAVCTDDMPRGKPSPDVYLETARLLGVSPKYCVCLEDSGNGILAGLAAGMRVIAVPDAEFPPAPEVIERAHLVLDSLTEFTPDLLSKLGKG